MFRAIILPSSGTMLPATGRKHRGCIIPQAATHSLVLLKMGRIISRNMLSWLELLISRSCCIYLVVCIIYINMQVRDMLNLKLRCLQILSWERHSVREKTLVGILHVFPGNTSHMCSRSLSSARRIPKRPWLYWNPANTVMAISTFQWFRSTLILYALLSDIIVLRYLALTCSNSQIHEMIKCLWTNCFSVPLLLLQYEKWRHYFR